MMTLGAHDDEPKIHLTWFLKVPCTTLTYIYAHTCTHTHIHTYTYTHTQTVFLLPLPKYPLFTLVNYLQKFVVKQLLIFSNFSAQPLASFPRGYLIGGKCLGSCVVLKSDLTRDSESGIENLFLIRATCAGYCQSLRSPLAVAYGAEALNSAGREPSQRESKSAHVFGVSG